MRTPTNLFPAIVACLLTSQLLAGDEPLSVTAQIERIKALENSYQAEKQAGKTESAEKLAKERDDLIRGTRGAADQQFQAALEQKNIERAEAILEEALPVLDAPTDNHFTRFYGQEQKVESWQRLGAAYASRRQWELSRDRYRSALELADTIRWPSSSVSAATFRGYYAALQQLGDEPRVAQLKHRAEFHRRSDEITATLELEAMHAAEVLFNERRTVNTMQNLPKRAQLARAEPLARDRIDLAKLAFPDQPLVLVHSYSSLAYISENLQKYDQMNECHRRIEELVKLPRPAVVSYPTNSELCRMFHDMGLRHSRRGEYERAIDLIEQAAKHYASAPGAEVPGDVWEDLGNIYQELRDFDKAEALLQKQYEQILAMRNKNAVAVWANHFYSARDYGYILLGRGKYQRAEEVFQLALTVNSQLDYFKPPQEQVLGIEITMAKSKYYQGKFAEAEKQIAVVQRKLDKQFGQGNPHRYYVLDEIPTIYESQGRFDEAETFWKKRLTTVEAASKTNAYMSDSLTKCIEQLAKFYVRRGNYTEAEYLFQRSVDRQWQKDLQPALKKEFVAKALLNKVALYEGAKDHARAIGHLEEGLKLIQHNPDAQQMLLSMLARNKTLAGDFAGARQALKQYDDILPLVQDPGSQSGMPGRLERARLQIYSGEAATGATAVREVAAEVNRVESSAAAGDLLVHIARLLLDRQCQAEARQMLAEAIAYQDQGLSPFGERATARQMQAELLWDDGQRPQAFAKLQEALDLAEQQRQATSSFEMDRAHSFASFQSAFERMIAWRIEERDVPGAFEAAERSSARSLVEQLAQESSPLTGIPPESLARLREEAAVANARVDGLKGQLDFVRRERITDAEREKRAAAIGRELTSARQAVVDVYREIRSLNRSELVSTTETSKPVDLAKLQSWLAEGPAILLQYVLGDDAGYCFVIRGNGLPQAVPLNVTAEQALEMGIEAGPLTMKRAAAALTRRVTIEGKSLDKSVIELLADQENCDLAETRLAQLWPLLIPEAVRSELLAGKIKRLAIVPTGPLAALPFEALITVVSKEGPQYLLDLGIPVVYAPSATVLYNLAQRPVAKLKEPLVLTVGGVAYDPPPAPVRVAAPRAVNVLAGLQPNVRFARAGTQLTPLPQSKRESEWVEEHFIKRGHQVQTLRGKDATEANLRQAISGRQLIHLACHGSADQSFGNFCGALRLVPGPNAATNSENDGFLTTPEIYALDLRGSELAILSACETNLGPQHRGEGVWTMSRAFLVAGSRRVVATNWPVNDKSSNTIVSYMTSHIVITQAAEETPDYAAALHYAKHRVRQESPWSSPFHWAPFVLVGPQ